VVFESTPRTHKGLLRWEHAQRYRKYPAMLVLCKHSPSHSQDGLRRAGWGGVGRGGAGWGKESGADRTRHEPAGGIKCLWVTPCSKHEGGKKCRQLGGWVVVVMRGGGAGVSTHPSSRQHVVEHVGVVGSGERLRHDCGHIASNQIRLCVSEHGQGCTVRAKPQPAARNTSTQGQNREYRWVLGTEGSFKASPT
jgi:hypothetical protein